jgi:hypothetical protein
MATSDQRKRRGAEILKKYLPSCSHDSYAAGADAIVDILFYVAQDPDDAARILQSAEHDFRSAMEGEEFLAEG